ncbi:jg8, partial [Pararge aegeria aegeria]
FAFLAGAAARLG